MQIILLEKIDDLGNLGDIVTVKSGYVRNFLTLSGKAKRAIEANTQEFEACRAELKARQAEILADAKARQEKLDGQTITIAQKADVDDCPFGSVTSAGIAAVIAASGIKAVKANVYLPNDPLKAIDEYGLEVVLYTDAVAKITVAVMTVAVE